MNTEHTNQSRQAEPATHSPIALQSIPKRQRGFTAENIRDIAHECMRIGDNEQAEVIFAIADALRDGNLTIHPAAVAVRIRELEAQLNAATHARQEAQQIAQEAIEARNRAGVEIRRPLLKRIRELQAQQDEPVNQQLLALVKSFGHKTGCAKNAFGELCTCGADEAIAAAEKAQANHIGGVNEMAQQAEPVAHEFFAYDSECGFETFKTEAEAKKYAQESIDAYREEASEGWSEAVENICWGVVLGTTREVELPDEYSGGNGLADSMKPVDYVLTDAAQPPAVAVAVPDGVLSTMRRASQALDASSCHEMAAQLREARHLLDMLAAAPQGAAAGWIDPNDKTQKQYLPHIGEPVLFCHDGVTYYGQHTGGSFETVNGFAVKFFETWDCLWMYPPAAAQKGGA